MNLRGIHHHQRQPTTGMSSVVGSAVGAGTGGAASGVVSSQSQTSHHHVFAPGPTLSSSSPDGEKFTDIIFMEETTPKVRILKNRK